MFASSSRVAVRTLRAGQVSSFSTSSPVFKSRTMVVELLQDVDNLGYQFDRVKVTAIHMRNNLAPYRLARWIPWVKGAPKPVPFLQNGTKPGGVPKNRLISQPGTASPQQPSFKSAEPTPTEILNNLALLPEVLTFERRTVSPTTPAIHGSLTLSDIHDRVAELGLTGKDVDIVWAGEDQAARMKELGTWDATVTVRGFGGEQVTLSVEVVRKE